MVARAKSPLDLEDALGHVNASRAATRIGDPVVACEQGRSDPRDGSGAGRASWVIPSQPAREEEAPASPAEARSNRKQHYWKVDVVDT